MMLRVENLHLRYGDFQALEGVSLEVGPGEVVAVVGANGAGKSSLIRSVSGMHRPQSGRVWFEGRDVTGEPTHVTCNLGLGHVAEGRQVFPTLTVRENLAVGAMLPRSRASQADLMESVFDLFPRLHERSGQRAGTLSGGEQQMLAIARCLMGRPRLIMLDEPSLGLSPTMVSSMFQCVRMLNEQQGMSVVLVEQNVVASLKLARRAYVLENGRVVAAGESAQLLNDPRIRQAYLGMTQ